MHSMLMFFLLFFFFLTLQIRCTKDQSCSGRSETVIITDMNYYPVAPFHFDLSGTAFGRLAKPGLNDKLRHSGIIDIEFTRSVKETTLYCTDVVVVVV